MDFLTSRAPADPSGPPHGEQQPAVTVIVPTYNRATLLPETVQSILAQTLAEWECIVVDDGSTDNTAAVVAAFADQDERIRYVWQKNSSASAARNRGLALARGRYICFLDSDDLFAPERLAWQVAELNRHPEVVFVYGDTFKFWNDNPSEGYLDSAKLEDNGSSLIFKALLTRSCIYAPLIRTSLIRQAGGFDESLHSVEDWDMWLTLSKKGPVIYHPRIATYYRMHPGNKSRDYFWNYSHGRRVVGKHLKALSLPSRILYYLKARTFFRNGYSRRLWQQAVDSYLAGSYLAAARILLVLSWLNFDRVLYPSAWWGVGRHLLHAARDRPPAG